MRVGLCFKNTIHSSVQNDITVIRERSGVEMVMLVQDNEPYLFLEREVHSLQDGLPDLLRAQEVMRRYIGPLYPIVVMDEGTGQFLSDLEYALRCERKALELEKRVAELDKLLERVE